MRGPRPLGRLRHRVSHPAAAGSRGGPLGEERVRSSSSWKPRLCGLRGTAGPRSPSSRHARPAARSSSSDHPQGEDDSAGHHPAYSWASTGTASCTASSRFAFQAARQRGIPLTAVHAWTPTHPRSRGDLRSPARGRAEGPQGPRAHTSTLAIQFPSITVVAELVPAIPLTARRPIPWCRLLVVGSRAEVTSWARCSGSVSQIRPAPRPQPGRKSSATTPGGERTHPPEASHIRSPNVIKTRSAR